MIKKISSLFFFQVLLVRLYGRWLYALIKFYIIHALALSLSVSLKFFFFLHFLKLEHVRACKKHTMFKCEFYFVINTTVI